MARRPTTDSESKGGGRRRKNSRGPRQEREESGEAERTAVGSPAINFHARIIIGKLESWLPDSRFVSPNESERVGPQRRAAAGGGGGSFRLYAASSKSSMLRRAIIIVSLASFPPRGRLAGQQIHAGLGRGSESWASLSKTGEGALLAAGRSARPKAGAVCKQWAAAGAAGPLSRCQLRAQAARPPSPPTSDSCGSREFTGRRGLGGGSPRRAQGPWPAFCESHTGLRKRTHRPGPG